VEARHIPGLSECSKEQKGNQKFELSMILWKLFKTSYITEQYISIQILVYQEFPEGKDLISPTKDDHKAFYYSYTDDPLSFVGT
jgi:hypothetical protein